MALYRDYCEGFISHGVKDCAADHLDEKYTILKEHPRLVEITLILTGTLGIHRFGH